TSRGPAGLGSERNRRVISVSARDQSSRKVFKLSAAPSAIKQATRLLGLDTPLGADVLVIEQFRGYESVAGLFSFELDLLADAQLGKDKSVKPESLIGKGVTVALEL